MFSKILIANRGEIACRVIRTARRMGVATVAVYSDADARSLHVSMADEAVRIGAAPVGESYLKGDVIIAAAKATGAKAIHPGFGFLSENPDFVDAVGAAGLVFIGPSSSAIRAMGLKDAAKKLMEEAGVPVVPGYHGAEQDADFLAAEAEKIGYPVLIKARAGGGGKGMRRVDDPAEFRAALASASSEGEASFGDGAVLIEKYILSPRHIEIQVFGDNHGDAIHLFERDCSLQRRHQKVIEEAPAPGMTAGVRDAMGAAAVKAAKTIGYSGAGTIEFIVDGADGLRPDGFWFMEMNTRLQVEHPVTEAITGVDLVEWQLRVAAGAPLPMTQDELKIDGWAFEARLYAEDAARGFLPATGRLDHLKFPEGTRIETGVRAGDEISPYYDPMIAKIVTHGADRAEALACLRAALEATEVAGSVTNIAFLARLAGHAGFMNGEVDTGLIERDAAELTAPPPVPPAARALAALAALGLPAASGPAWERRDGFRLWGPARALARLDGALLRIEVAGDEFTVADDDAVISLSVRRNGDALRVDDGDRVFAARAVRHGGAVTIFMDGAAHGFSVPDMLAAGSDAATGGDMVLSPMPGLVKSMMAEAGATVELGAPLCVLEAMKMEHTLKAPRAGVIAAVAAAAGDQVEEGAILITLEPSED
ncbi:ATP-grasp domain-containing protein [Pikeienuella piscinae]|uniref:ATP-grasp domain-containing protein n=1 Tax=Pikeienuella piscinae TaxID=2748098 RepID=A0A7M3T5S2_9RHOB|nr:biotin carboxylase N-terminal domain-containing protein [Pikeienuella piscinae]QIE57353.1 ATP-grasp domain-containing protein [Pikeienuella piscinae]